MRGHTHLVFNVAAVSDHREGKRALGCVQRDRATGRLAAAALAAAAGPRRLAAAAGPRRLAGLWRRAIGRLLWAAGTLHHCFGRHVSKREIFMQTRMLDACWMTATLNIALIDLEPRNGESAAVHRQQNPPTLARATLIDCHCRGAAHRFPNSRPDTTLMTLTPRPPGPLVVPCADCDRDVMM